MTIAQEIAALAVLAHAPTEAFQPLTLARVHDFVGGDEVIMRYTPPKQRTFVLTSIHVEDFAINEVDAGTMWLSQTGNPTTAKNASYLALVDVPILFSFTSDLPLELNANRQTTTGGSSQIVLRGFLVTDDTADRLMTNQTLIALPL